MKMTLRICLLPLLISTFASATFFAEKQIAGSYNPVPYNSAPAQQYGYSAPQYAHPVPSYGAQYPPKSGYNAPTSYSYSAHQRPTYQMPNPAYSAPYQQAYVAPPNQGLFNIWSIFQLPKFKPAPQTQTYAANNYAKPAVTNYNYAPPSYPSYPNNYYSNQPVYEVPSPKYPAQKPADYVTTQKPYASVAYTTPKYLPAPSYAAPHAYSIYLVPAKTSGYSSGNYEQAATSYRQPPAPVANYNPVPVNGYSAGNYMNQALNYPVSTPKPYCNNSTTAKYPPVVTSASTANYAVVTTPSYNVTSEVYSAPDANATKPQARLLELFSDPKGTEEWRPVKINY